VKFVPEKLRHQRSENASTDISHPKRLTLIPKKGHQQDMQGRIVRQLGKLQARRLGFDYLNIGDDNRGQSR